jgi:hypothetical protein
LVYDLDFDVCRKANSEVGAFYWTVPARGPHCGGESGQAGDHIPVLECEIGRSDVNELAEHRQGSLLHSGISQNCRRA